MSQNGWIRTADRLPDEDDGYITVVTVGAFGHIIPITVWYQIVLSDHKRYPYWISLPQMPEEL